MTGRRDAADRRKRRARGRTARDFLQSAGGKRPAGHSRRLHSGDAEHRRVASEERRFRHIVFARARLTVEVLVRYLKDMVRDPLGNAGRVRGYRGGYLRHPAPARSSASCGRDRSWRVVSTNALELGIDIGQLDACVLCGYPGTIASTWQQAGRAGRRGASVAADRRWPAPSPLDQYIINHPDYFFGQSPETALINPDNLYILHQPHQVRGLRAALRGGGEVRRAGGQRRNCWTIWRNRHSATGWAGGITGWPRNFPQAGIESSLRLRSEFPDGGHYRSEKAPGHRRDGPLHRAHAAAQACHLHA